MPNVRSCADDCVVADFGASFDDRMRLDRHPLPQLSAWIDNRAWMNTGCEGDRLRREFEHDLLEGLGRIGGTNFSGGILLATNKRNKDGAQPRFAMGAKKCSRSQESNIQRSPNRHCAGAE